MLWWIRTHHHGCDRPKRDVHDGAGMRCADDRKNGPANQHGSREELSGNTDCHHRVPRRSADLDRDGGVASLLMCSEGVGISRLL